MYMNVQSIIEFLDQTLKVRVKNYDYKQKSNNAVKKVVKKFIYDSTDFHHFFKL